MAETEKGLKILQYKAPIGLCICIVVFIIGFFLGLPPSPIKVPYHYEYQIVAFLVGIIFGVVSFFIGINTENKTYKNFEEVSISLGMVVVLLVLIFDPLIVKDYKDNPSNKTQILGYAPKKYKVVSLKNESHREKERTVLISPIAKFKADADMGKLDNVTATLDRSFKEVIYTGIPIGDSFRRNFLQKAIERVNLNWADGDLGHQPDLKLSKDGRIRIKYYKKQKHPEGLPFVNID